MPTATRTTPHRVLGTYTLRESAILQSMGSVGDPWDNALQESGIGTIKAEFVACHDFVSRTQARLRIFVSCCG